MDNAAVEAPQRRPDALLRRGRWLETATLAWNVIGVGVLAALAVTARSVALAGFGLDSVIEIGASVVVLWELADSEPDRQPRALRLIGTAFVLLACYLTVQGIVALVARHHAHHSVGGIAWTAVTAIVMFALAAGKSKTGRLLSSAVMIGEGRVTFIDGLLAVAVLAGLVLNWAVGWWWADPLAGFVLVFYASREAFTLFSH